MSNLEILEKGKTYWIQINDCCVEGTFQGRFIGFMLSADGKSYTSYYTLPENYEDIDMYPQIHFNTGYVEARGAVTFREVPS